MKQRLPGLKRRVRVKFNEVKYLTSLCTSYHVHGGQTVRKNNGIMVHKVHREPNTGTVAEKETQVLLLL